MPGRHHRPGRAGAAVAGIALGAAALLPALAVSQFGGTPVSTQIAASGQSAGSVTTVPVPAAGLDLCAKPGTIAVGGATIAIWGYAVKPDGVACADAPAATLPGPALEVAEGAAVTIRLHNALGERTSLVFGGDNGVVPDLAGVAPGAIKEYTFTPGDVGTFLYESGVASSRQVPLGLHGALVVRPAAPGQAYGADTAYDREAIMVLSEIDPALHAAPGTFDLRNYTPRYWLINGRAFPQTDLVAAAAGQTLLVRWLNAGNRHQTMTLLGAGQRVIAKDAVPERHPYEAVAETVPAGQTVDVLVHVPTDAPSGTRLPLYSRDMRVTTDGSFPGGLLTYVEVP
jgi:FtsP/CotA-like multicopper oxidase with cupredoxin domain